MWCHQLIGVGVVVELGDTPTLGSRMRNKYRIVCEIAMKEQWTKKQFIDQIKQTTNEMIKNEIEKEGQDGSEDRLDEEAVKGNCLNLLLTM